MTLQELLTEKIKKAQERLEILRKLAQDDRSGGVQHAHGYLNALADLRTELVAKGII